MLDVTLLRNDPAAIERSLTRRGVDIDVSALVELDEKIRRARHDAESLRAEQKSAGQKIAQLDGDAKQAAIAEMGRVSERYKELSAEVEQLEARFAVTWSEIPNLVDDTAAEGFTDEDNDEIKRIGEQSVFDFEPRDHASIGELLDIIDTERGAKVSGSRFGYIKGKAVLLELGLVRFAMDLLVGHGFTPMAPPVLVREQALYGTGFFPGDREQVYAVPEDDLYLVGTAEVPLAAYHTDEIFEADQLPIRYAGFSSCFRREAGTYGKDTAGIFRVHQFDKVEMFTFVLPEMSKDEHDRLLAVEEEIVSAYDVPYRVVNVAAGDLGSSAAKKYDIEAWFPTQGTYREVTSCSNTTDFQARRLRIRYRAESGNEIVHTLNGTAVAVGRSILTILENHQQADGSVVIPEKLRPHVGFDVIEAP